jgi:hypothetical protein
MFDADTVDLIRSAPPLEGLELDDLPKVLTRAYSRIVSLRMRLRSNLSAEAFEAELGDMTRELETIALTHEVFVAVTPDRENRASAAFVAASAHQLRFSAERLLSTDQAPSRLTIEAIAPEIASTLMFLIAGRAADAAQMSRTIRFGDRASVEDNLRRSIVDLARGQLQNIVSGEWTFPEDITFDDAAAATALWARDAQRSTYPCRPASRKRRSRRTSSSGHIYSCAGYLRRARRVRRISSGIQRLSGSSPSCIPVAWCVRHACGGGSRQH